MSNLTKKGEKNMNDKTDSRRSDSRIPIIMSEYMEDVSYRRYSAKTLYVYGIALEDFTTYLAGEGVLDVQAVTCRHVEAYRSHIFERGFEQASVAVYLRSIRRFFGWLAERQRIFENPADIIGPLKRVNKLMSVPSEDEIAKLLAAPDVETPSGIRDRAILELAYSTAARREEIAGIKIDDIDMDHCTVLIRRGKGGKQRMLPIGSEALKWVKRYITEVRGDMATSTQERMLWLGSSKDPLTKEGIAMMIRRHSLKAGTYPRTGPHCIRRACATHMLLHGASPVQIQMLLGHASMRHLSQYLRLTISEIRQMHGNSVLGQ